MEAATGQHLEVRCRDGAGARVPEEGVRGEDCQSGGWRVGARRQAQEPQQARRAADRATLVHRRHLVRCPWCPSRFRQPGMRGRPQRRGRRTGGCWWSCQGCRGQGVECPCGGSRDPLSGVGPTKGS